MLLFPGTSERGTQPPLGNQRQTNRFGKLALESLRGLYPHGRWCQGPIVIGPLWDLMCLLLFYVFHVSYTEYGLGLTVLAVTQYCYVLGTAPPQGDPMGSTYQ